MEASSSARTDVEGLLKLCKEKGLLELPEVRKARSHYRDADTALQKAFASKLDAILVADERVRVLDDWFGARKVDLLKSGLESDDIAEALLLANRYLSRPNRYESEFLSTISQLENTKAALEKAVTERQELLEKSESVGRELDRLFECDDADNRNELLFLRSRLERFQAQVRHGYTPELETLKNIAEALGKMKQQGKIETAELDPLEEATNAFLDRYETQLSLAESRELKDGLEEIKSELNLPARWSFWSRLRVLEEKYSTSWLGPKIKKKSGRKKSTEKVDELWSTMATIQDRNLETDDADSHWSVMALSFKKSGKKQRAELKQLRKKLGEKTV